MFLLLYLLTFTKKHCILLIKVNVLQLAYEIYKQAIEVATTDIMVF